VCIDEEIFAATVAIMAEGMLKMDLQRSSLTGGDAAAEAAATGSSSLQQLASDVASLVAITNTFLAQPWKKWAYLACPRLCQVCVGCRAWTHQTHAFFGRACTLTTDQTTTCHRSRARSTRSAAA
jgi:hypothetical protein